MNEELSDMLVDFVGKTLKSIEDVASGAAEKLPDVLEQVLVYELTVSIIYNISALVIFVFMCAAIRWVSKSMEDKSEVAGLILGFVIVFIILILVLIDLRFVKILLAPDVFLIEYAREFVK